MNSKSATLYSLSQKLLNLGIDGSPVYSDHFTHLNREVHTLALELYNAIASTPEAEAELCLSLLVAFNATYCDNGHKQQYIQHLLNRSFEVLPLLPASLLKVRLLAYCYGEVYEDTLLQEAHAIIEGWDKTTLSAEQMEVIEELQNIEENPYPYEVIE